MNKLKEYIKAFNQDVEFMKVDLSQLFFVKDLHDPINGYFSNCLTAEGYEASGVHILGANYLLDENSHDSSPGGILNHYGYFIFATSIGGNVLVVSEGTRNVYWADSSSFSSDTELAYKDRINGEWVYVPYSHQNVEKALVLLNSNFEDFIRGIVRGDYTNILDNLDS